MWNMVSPLSHVADMLAKIKRNHFTFTTKHIQAHTNDWLTLFHNFVLMLNIQQSLQTLVGNPPIIMILCSSNAAVARPSLALGQFVPGSGLTFCHV